MGDGGLLLSLHFFFLSCHEKEKRKRDLLSLSLFAMPDETAITHIPVFVL